MSLSVVHYQLLHVFLCPLLYLSRFNLRRDHLLEDSYRIIMSSSAKTLRAKHIHVTWDQEEGLDYGGPQREFFFKLSRHLFNPYYGLFEYTSHGAYTVQISRFSSQIEDSLQWYICIHNVYVCIIILYFTGLDLLVELLDILLFKIICLTCSLLVIFTSLY